MNDDLDNKKIFGKYKITKMIGRGSFGSVFRGKNLENNELVALKVEDWRKRGNVLESEAYFLYYLKNYGIPEIKSFGIYNQYKILVQTLLGVDLEHLFTTKVKNLNYKDVCMAFIQLLDRLEYIHSKYVIHRDLKPENIMIDRESKKIIYLIDFGMAKKYRSGKTRKHIKYSVPGRLTGTARYCSINALRGTEQSRRDDLESAGYVMIYLAQRGYLPWMGLTNPDKLERYRQIYRIKKRLTEEELCRKLPSAFIEYMKYTKKLNFEEDPNYNYMRSLFIKLLNADGFQNDFKFSWVSAKTNKAISIQNNQRNHFLKRKGSPQGRILKQIQTSQEKEKKMDNIKKEQIINILEEKQEKRDKEILKINEKEMMIKTPNKNKNENVNCIQETPSFNKATKENSHNEGFKEIKKEEDDATQIAQLDMPILVDDSDENIKNNKNDNNINENVFKINSAYNINNTNNINNINNNKNESENKENNNIFFFSNDSFKESENFGEINQSKEKKVDNNKDSQNQQQDKDKKVIKTIENEKYVNKSPNNIFSIKNNINPINKTITGLNNLNKGKIINITTKYNKMLGSRSNSSNEIDIEESPKKFQFKQKLNDVNIKDSINLQKMKSNKINLNQIKFNDNIISDTNNPYDKIIPMRNIYINEDKNKKKFKIKKINNSYDFKRNPNLKRKIINYNIMNIKNSKSEGKKILRITPNNIVNNDYNKILVNNNSAKDMRRIDRKLNDNIINRNMIIKNLNVSAKQNLTLNTNSNFDSHRIKKKKLITNIKYKNVNDKIEDNKILRNKKLNKIILPKNKINNNSNERLKMDYFPFNVGQFDPRYNNNFINNLNYSVNYIKDVNRSVNNSSLNRNQNNIKHNRTSNYQGIKKIKITKIGIKNLSPINYKGFYVPQKYKSPTNNYVNNILRKNKFTNSSTNIQNIAKYKSPF